MKGKSRAISKKLSAITLSCLVIFGTVGAVLPTYAADPVKGIEIKADRTELDQSVSDAKNAGAEIVQDADVDKGVVKSEAEADSKRAEIEADYKQQVQQLKDAKKAAQKYSQDKKKYDEAKKKYDAELAKYNIAKKKYDDELTAYNKAMEELEKKKNEDGYMEEPNPQTLHFKSEPNAKLSVSTKTYQGTDWLNAVEQMGYPKGSEIYKIAQKYNRYSLDEGASRIFLEKDKTVTAYYSHLQNSYFNGKKISGVEYKYTLRKLTGGQTKIPAILYSNPTTTINYSDLGGTAEIDMEVVFYGEDNQPIDTTGALINFSSLNRDDDNGVDRSEYVRNFSGKYIQIHGSSIRDGGDGVAISSSRSNEHIANGSKFEAGVWDTDNSPKSWYGAIVGKTTGKTVKVTFGASNRKSIWFAFNSDIKAIGVPTKPTEPTKPTPPKEPQCPPLDISYHYDVLYYQPPVEKTVIDQDNADINNKTVQKNSIVKFVLNVADLPAGREKVESLVFNDILPEGYAVDLVGTRQVSSNYDITYDATTRRMIFTAKADMLTRINSDLSKNSKVPAPIVTGKVTKEETTYVNDFDLTINNTYTVRSNQVKVNTPTKPGKPQISHPKTGDDHSLPLYGMLLVISAGVGACVLQRRKQS